MLALRFLLYLFIYFSLMSSAFSQSRPGSTGPGGMGAEDSTIAPPFFVAPSGDNTNSLNQGVTPTPNPGGQGVGNAPEIPAGAIRYTGGHQNCETVFFGYTSDSIRPDEVWYIPPDDYEERYERYYLKYEDRLGNLHPDKGSCELSNIWLEGVQLAGWTLDPEGGAKQLPIAVAIIFSVIGFAFIVRSGFNVTSSRFGFDAEALYQLKKIINYSESPFGVASESSLDWIEVVVSKMQRLDAEGRYYIRRVRLLQGISIAIFGLAIALFYRSAFLFLSDGIPNFATGFVIAFPFSVLLIAAGFLINQSDKTLKMRLQTIAEINETQSTLARGLAIVTSEIDVEKIFQRSVGVREGDHDEGQSIISEKEFLEKSKDLAKILAYWQKFGA